MDNISIYLNRYLANRIFVNTELKRLHLIQLPKICHFVIKLSLSNIKQILLKTEFHVIDDFLMPKFKILKILSIKKSLSNMLGKKVFFYSQLMTLFEKWECMLQLRSCCASGNFGHHR